MQPDIDTASVEEDVPVPPEAVPERNARHKAAFSGLTAVIKAREKNFKAWNETAAVTSLSSGGAGFFLSRPCVAGRLISIMIAMPTHLRRYDQGKKLYRTWGLVQYCYEAGGEEDAGFHVGVALIGKDAPKTYSKNPLQSYRVSGMDAASGLWKIVELETSFKLRASVRYWNATDVWLHHLDDDLRSIKMETGITENVSEFGASVFSGLNVDVGDRVRFQCSSPQFSSLSIVRNHRVGPDLRKRIHLEFVENIFPVRDIDAPIEQEGEH